MPTGLVRYQKAGNFHFITFSCYQRLPLLSCGEAYWVFEEELEAVRRAHGFVVAGYVLMPEHVHLLVNEPPVSPLSLVIQVLKQKTSRKLKSKGDLRFWHTRYYDFNVWTQKKHVEKLRYMHRNPVTRGLVEKPGDWPWSSFVHYATGALSTVEIELEWAARRRDLNQTLVNRQFCSPPFAKNAKDGAPSFLDLGRK